MFKTKRKAKECRDFHRAELKKQDEETFMIDTTGPTPGKTQENPTPQNPRYEVSPCDTPNMEDSDEEQTCAHYSDEKQD